MRWTDNSTGSHAMPYEDCPECGTPKHPLNKCSHCGFTRASKSATASSARIKAPSRRVRSQNGISSQRGQTGSSTSLSASHEKKTAPENPNISSVPTLSVSELEALRPTAAWISFIKRQAQAYWQEPYKVVHINCVLLAAFYLKRYIDTQLILAEIAFHQIDQSTGLFNPERQQGSRQESLAKKWKEILFRSLVRLERQLDRAPRFSANQSGQLVDNHTSSASGADENIIAIVKQIMLESPSTSAHAALRQARDIYRNRERYKVTADEKL